MALCSLACMSRMALIQSGWPQVRVTELDFREVRLKVASSSEVLRSGGGLEEDLCAAREPYYHVLSRDEAMARDAAARVWPGGCWASVHAHTLHCFDWRL